MSETHGTAQATESPATTVEAAAERIEALLSGSPGDSDGDETQEGETSDDGEEEAPADPDAADESDETDEPDDSEETPQTFTVKIDGEDKAVTLDELTRGYSRTADYTRKTMALAEDRKAFDAERQDTTQTREAYTEALVQMKAMFAPVEDDAEALQQLRQDNPAEWSAKMEEKRQRQDNLRTVEAEQARVVEEAQREAAEKHAETVKAEEAKLLERFPEWSDAAKRSAGEALIVDYAINSLGLTADEVNKISDHRLVVALSKAAKWDALQAKKPAVQAKVEAAKVVKPGSTQTQRAPVSDVTRAKQRLAKTGRVQDAALALEHLL